MKEMIRRVREERGGFTLAELLIVVAIIMVLVAIAVPIFMGALNNAQASVDAANERSLKSQATTDFLIQGGPENFSKEYWITNNGDIYTVTTDDATKYTVTVEETTNGDFIVTVTPETP